VNYELKDKFMPTIIKKPKVTSTSIPAPSIADFEGTPSAVEMPPTPAGPSGPLTPMGDSDFSGDWDSGDLKLPRVELKHGVDTRYPDIAPGRFVYARSNEDYLELIPPFSVTFLRAVKGYLQPVEQGDIPMIARTKAEVFELGGATEQGRPDAPFWAPLADTLVLVSHSARKTWPGTTLFDICGEKTAAATYRIKATAFKEIGTVLASWERFQKMGGNMSARIFDVEWELGSHLRNGATFSYFVPTLKEKRIHTTSEQKALMDIGGNL
jgi:hypothetical protein